jgi:hypothetical protein
MPPGKTPSARCGTPECAKYHTALIGNFLGRLAFSKEIANWPTMLSRITIQTSGYKIVERVVAATRYRRDMVECGGESSQLFPTISTLIIVSLVDLRPVLSNVVIIDFTFGDRDFGLRFDRRP